MGDISNQEGKLLSVEIPENNQLSDLLKISDKNISQAVSFMKHSLDLVNMGDDQAPRYVSNLNQDELSSIIVSPGSRILSPELSHVNLDLSEKFFDKYKSKQDQLRDAIRNLEDKKMDALNRNKFLDKRQYRRFNNVNIVDSIDGFAFKKALDDANPHSVLIMSDTAYTRNMDFYKRTVSILMDRGIPFVEYTNIQPDLDRRLVVRIAEFAHDHECDLIIVIGSMSTVELSKVVLPRLIKPHLFRLHRSDRVNIPERYKIFSIPTLVVPDPKVNARFALRNNVLIPDLSYFGDTRFLINLFDDSDAVFYCADLFNELSHDKLVQLLHEMFFGLIFSYFDLSASQENSDLIIGHIRSVVWYLEFITSGYSPEEYDRLKILEIVAFILDGKFLPSIDEFYVWYRLEASLSMLVNSNKSQGLALFLPTCIEVVSGKSVEFRERAVGLGNRLYGSHSIEGLNYNLSLHIRRFGLPMSFLDIPSIKRIDRKFLLFLTRRTSVNPFSNQFVRGIIRNLSIW